MVPCSSAIQHPVETPLAGPLRMQTGMKKTILCPGTLVARGLATGPKPVGSQVTEGLRPFQLQWNSKGSPPLHPYVLLPN